MKRLALLAIAVLAVPGAAFAAQALLGRRSSTRRRPQTASMGRA